MQSTALNPDYGLFSGYQMLAKKDEGLNTCLCLLCKNLNNLAELGIHAAQEKNHRSNTKYCESISQLHAFITSAMPVPGMFEIVCPEQFELCLNACGWVNQHQHTKSVYKILITVSITIYQHTKPLFSVSISAYLIDIAFVT